MATAPPTDDFGDFPTILVAGVYPSSRSSGNSSDHFLLSSQNRLKNLSRQTLKQHGKNIQQLFKETVDEKPSLSKHTLKIGDDDYFIFIFPTTEDDLGLFLCESTDTFFTQYKLNENEPALSVLPFLDGALSYFLSRAEIYGPEFAKKKQTKKSLQHMAQDSGKLSRRVSIGETFSLEEVFRTFDTDGAGALTLENFRSGLRAAGLTISDKDAALVFNAMAYRTMKPKTPSLNPNDSGDAGDEQKVLEPSTPDIEVNQTTVSYFQFYSFFDGARLNKITTRAQVSPVVVSPTSMQTANFSTLLGTVNENDDETENENIDIESDTDDESKKAEMNGDSSGNKVPAITTTTKDKLPVGAANKVMQKHILKVKQAIFECLNMGSDHTLFSEKKGASSPVKGGKHARSKSIDIDSDNTNKIDVEKALTKLNHCDTLKQMMQDNIYQTPTQQDMIKWDNRFRAHNIRIQNFREILNGALAIQMRKLKQELADIDLDQEIGQLGTPSVTTPVGGGKHGRQKSSTTNLLTEAAVNAWNTPSSPNPRHGHSRSISRGHSRRFSSMTGSDFGDDTSSVESDTSLIYVPGKELKGEKMEEMLTKFRNKNKENKQLTKKIKSLKLELKNQKMQFDKDIKKLQSKLDKSNRENTELKTSNQDVRSKLRSMSQNKKSNKSTNNLSSGSADAQREISKLNREIKKLRASLEAETITKEASQERVRQLLKAKKQLENDDTGNENGTISQRKIARLEKDLSNKDNELTAKRKKLDEMFIKLKTYENRLNTIVEENSGAKAKVQGLNRRIQELQSENEKLQARADEKSKIAGEVKQLTTKVTDLKEKLTRMRARNQKLKLKIERLMSKLKDLETHQSETTKLRKELMELEKEKRQIMQSSDVNSKEMQDRLAELEKIMNDKDSELANAMAELERFKEELSAEYESVKQLQDALEEKDQMINDKDEEVSVQIARLEALVEHNEKLAAQYKSRLGKCEKQKDQLHTEYSQLQAANDDCKSEINDLNSQLAEKDNELKLLRIRQGEAEKKIQNQEIMSNELQNKLDKISGLEADLATTKESELAAREEYEVKCQNFDELMEKWKALQKSEEINIAKIEELQANNKKLKSKKMKQNDEDAVKLKQYELQLDTIDKLKKEISMQKTSIQRWKAKFNAQEELTNKNQTEFDQMKIDIEDMQAQIDKLKKQNKEYRKKLGLSGVGKDKDKNAMALMEQNVDTLMEKVRNRDFEIKKLKNQLKAVGKGGSLDSGNLEQRAKQLESECKRQEDVISENTEKIQNLEAESEVLKQQVADKNEKINELQREKEEIEMKLDKVSATEDDSEAEKRRQSNVITKKTSEIGALRKQVLDLENEIQRLKEIELEKARIETEFEDLKAQMDELASGLDANEAP